MASHTEWGKDTTAEVVAKSFSNEILGKNVIISGVSPKSLGNSMALAIASQSPALLILASRTLSKIEAVISQILTSSPSLLCIPVVVDLSSQTSIRKAAQEINSLTPTIDILINNAGVMVPDRRSTKENIEMQFGTNHIGPFLLTNLLMPNLLKAAMKARAPGRTRIINVTSAGHRLSPIRFSDYNIDKRAEDIPAQERPATGLPPSFLPKEGQTYSGFLAYGQSKTANVLFSLSLTKYFASQGIVSFAVHPGSIWTDLSRNLDEELTKAVQGTGTYWKSQDQGAATMLVAAFDPLLDEAKGLYLSDCQIEDPSAHAKNSVAAENLWKLSEELVGVNFYTRV